MMFLQLKLGFRTPGDQMCQKRHGSNEKRRIEQVVMLLQDKKKSMMLQKKLMLTKFFQDIHKKIS